MTGGYIAVPCGYGVAKQLKAAGRVYPHDMHGILLKDWDNKPFFKNWPKAELPPKSVLDELMDVCFHASLLMEEGRPTVFKVVFLSGSASVSRHPGPVTPVTKYTFQARFSSTRLSYGDSRR